ncbi:MAG: hypothetical protein Ta2B_05660 [Termitinemataceae bacterium]|nr:MAG: hypothetical protein Ta2B_05660 [Termitinemataceae bacterium]
MAQTHSFSVPLATEYGLQESVFLSNLCFWIEKNIANNRHFHDGRWWTYNSVTAWHELLTYISVDSIRNTISTLQKRGAIVIGNYNKIGYDRTQWFAVSPKVFSLWSTGTYECPVFDFLRNVGCKITSEAEKNQLKRETKPDEIPTKNGDFQSLQNCEVHVVKTPNGVGKIAKSMWENPQMDLGKPPNGFGENPTPIPDLTRSKPVAVADFEKKSEGFDDAQKETAAATADDKIKNEKPPSPPLPNTGKKAAAADAVKGELLRIDKELVMSSDFYDNAVKFMLQNGVDIHYIKFVYDECIKKRDHTNIRGLFYKMFFAEDICESFKIIVSPPPLQDDFICPVCGVNHIKQLAVCPGCGLENIALYDPERLKRYKQIYSLGDKRVLYEKEIIGVVSDLSNFLSASKQKKAIDAKYGITV